MRKINEFDKEYFLNLISKELERQYNKFGIQNYSLERWLSITLQVIGKITKEINDNFDNDDSYSYKNLRKEIIHSITCLIQMYIQSLQKSVQKRLK